MLMFTQSLSRAIRTCRIDVVSMRRTQLMAISFSRMMMLLLLALCRGIGEAITTEVQLHCTQAFTECCIN